ncbi:hypothetical protein B0I35DRAFT_452390 [Stachybotrys elegans]|uniref:Threonine/serine exporter-like N-terminal domain-containing protein n=1 Tax=Stachybotrys elegans TaxID=80388 RepID=A0A8K0SMC7_9HYPO|nr:hypothetical protein B0I35DRAFT_452390 [Stachybotrys elegans]
MAASKLTMWARLLSTCEHLRGGAWDGRHARPDSSQQASKSPVRRPVLADMVARQTKGRPSPATSPRENNLPLTIANLFTCQLLEIPGPKLPRPALRRNTSYDVPEERETADRAEKQASQRQLQSLTDARNRAHRLARSVGSYSAPASRRNSFDRDKSTFQHPMSDSDDHDDTPEDDDQFAAETLVKSHTRGRKHLFQSKPRVSMSGTSTPVLHQAYAHDYVPRPKKYRGGILASLLKLYNDDRGASGSGNTTPSAPATPLMSPRPSPPNSRPTSIVGSPRSRPSSGLFSYHKSHHSTSSLALTELIKSSSMFAVPGSSEIHDQWSEKIKKDDGIPYKPKKEKERIRITVHIAGIIARHRYLIKLCRALMLYGAPTHRLEEYMQMSARVLEIEGQFLYMPSCMIISFDDSTTHTTEVKVVRVHQGIDLGKLREVHNIYKDVVHDKVGVEEATKRLEFVMGKKQKFPVAFCVFMYGVASACVAPFAFQGRFIDLPICFVLGCIVGVLQLVFAPSNELYAHVFEVTAAIITSFIARGFGSIRNGEVFCFGALAQSSIALILPGYMVLCGSLELQSHNLVSGSVRMVHAMIYTLFLGYGITIGASLYGMMDRNASSHIQCPQPLQREWNLLFVPAFTLCLCIVNQAQWKQTPVMVFMGLAGFCVNSYCSQYFEGNTQISNMLGALTIGILANLYSRTGRYFENAWLDVKEWWLFTVRPRLARKKRRSGDAWPHPQPACDPESGSTSPDEEKPQRQARQVGYSLAAAAMLPAIFVQVPSGLAAGGSLLAGVNSANLITGNTTTNPNTSGTPNFDSTAFNVLLSVIQVAIGISVGLFMSALIVYPLGKRRSGLFSF